MKLTVVCMLWQGWRRAFTAENVNILHNMCKAHIHKPHRFICITDTPEGINCETYPIWPNPCDIRGRDNYRKLRLFDKATEFGDTVMYLDLDTIIRDEITDLTESPDDLTICKGKGAPYNSSYMLIKSGTNRHLWDEFDPVESPKEVRRAGYVGTDQVWISLKAKARTIGKESGVMMYGTHRRNIDGHRLIFFPVTQKPWQMQQTRRDIYEEYMQYADSSPEAQNT